MIVRARQFGYSVGEVSAVRVSPVLLLFIILSSSLPFLLFLLHHHHLLLLSSYLGSYYICGQIVWRVQTRRH